MSTKSFLNLLRYLVLAVVLVGSLALLVPISMVKADSVVAFPDANLEAAIREAIGKPAGDIYESDLSRDNFTTLSAENRGIVNLTGLEYCTALTVLDLLGNQTDNLTPLTGLTGLTLLVLEDNQIIEDITPLSGLTNLTYLDLNFNQIEDISPVAGLTRLTTLYLHGNQTDNLTPLSGLTSLMVLGLDSNQVSDLSPLSSLTNLQRLSLNSNEISDLTPLAGLTNLWYLRLSNNQVNDISTIAALTKLTSLFLVGNKISDLTPLSGLTNLTGLWLIGNQIGDLMPLSGLTNLSVLSLYSNLIRDIQPLVNNQGIGSGDAVELWSNPLNANTVNTCIPALQDRGVTVGWDLPVSQNPNQPSNESPDNGVTGLGLTPTLQSSLFSDNDTLDTHAASQWQVTPMPGDYSSPVFDSDTDSSNLTSITVPLLGYSVTYYWRVAHQDNHGDWSAWSAETSFGTAAAPQADFAADRTAVIVGQNTQFTNLSSGGVAPLTYQWDFNNDGIWDSTDQNPTYAYTAPGTRAVVLIVTDAAANTDTETKTAYVTVYPAAPTLLSPANGATVTGTSVTFEWTPVPGATDYKLVVNTTNNLYASGRKTSLMVGNTNTYVDSGYPANGTRYYWWVVAYAGSTYSNYTQVIANGFSFTNAAAAALGTPTLVLPANGGAVAGTSVTYEWTLVTGATDYKLIVNTTNNLYASGRRTAVMAGNTNTYVDSGYPANGTRYYWWVVAYAGSTYSNYTQVIANGFSFTNAGGLGTPTLVSPANGATAAGNSVTFEWTLVTGATNYKLIVNTTNNLYASGRKTAVMAGNTNTYVDSGYPANGTTYYWWVVAYDSSGGNSDYGQVIANGFSFTSRAGLGTPTLVSPANGATAAGNSVTFQWTLVSGATNYKLIVNKTNNLYATGRKTALMVGNTNTYVDSGYPANGTTYYWWVVAYDSSGGNSDYGQVIANGFSFTSVA